jgi:DNA repair exonuclease SbcCD ATPase subunit
LNNTAQMDLISPILHELKDMQNIIYLKKSGVYPVGKNINFYHLSMIDKLIPLPTDSTRTSIALLHEEISGSKHGEYVFKNTRLTKEILSKYDLVLCGHLHDVQFLTPTIAYCGSLIQQDPGEKDSKGYIQWNLTQSPASGEFIRLPNDYAYVKLKLVDGQVVSNIDEGCDCMPKFAHKIYVEHTNSSKEDIDNAIQKIEKQFNKRVDRIESKDVQGIKLNSHDILNNSESQEKLIREFLLSKATPEQIEQIIGMHQQHLSSRNKDENKTKPTGNYRWRLDYLTWKNMFCYREGNYIDFTKLYGVTGIIGKNKSGKSSVLDILIFALFNKLIRGDRKNIINKGATGGIELKVGFSIPTGRDQHNNITYDKYELTRKDDRSKHVSCKLLKNGGTGETGSDLSGVSLDKTYEKLSTLIGTVDTFLTTLMMVQKDEYNLIELERVKRKLLLNKFFGVDVLEDINETSKEEVKEIKAICKSLKDPANGMKLEEMDAIITNTATSLTTAQEQLQSLIKSNEYKEMQKEELCKKLNQLDTTITLQQLNTNLENVEKQIATLTNSLSTIGIDAATINTFDLAELYKQLELVPEKPKLSLVELKKTIETLLAEDKQIEESLKSIPTQDEIVQLLTKQTLIQQTIETLIGSINSAVNTSVSLNIDINLISKKLSEAKEKIPNGTADLTTLKQEEQTITAEITALQSTEHKIQLDITTNKSKINNHAIDSVNRQQKIVNDCRSKAIYRFNDGCADCKTNKNYLYASLKQNEDILSELEATQLKINSENDRLSTIVNTSTNDLLSTVNQRKTKSDRLNVLRDQIKTLEEIAKYTKMIEYKTSYDKNLQTQSEINKAKEEQSSISKIITNANQSNEKRKRCDEIKHAVANLNNIIEIYTQIDTINQRNKETDTLIKKIEQMKKISQDLTTATENKAKLTTVATKLKQNNDLNTQITNLKTEIANIKIEIARQTTSIQNFTDGNTRATKTKADLIKYNEDVVANATKLKLYELYQKCLDGKQGIPNVIMGKTIKVLETEINKMLSSIADFTMSFTDDNNLDIILNEPGKDAKDIPVELGSGFQKFVLNIITRVCLSRLSDTVLSNFIIIDEGFGCLDEFNLASVQQFLTSICTMFDFVFVISHVDQMHVLLNNPLMINIGQNHISTINNAPEIKLVITPPSIFEELEDNLVLCTVCAVQIKASGKSTHIKTKKHLAAIENSVYGTGTAVAKFEELTNTAKLNELARPVVNSTSILTMDDIE